MGAKWFRRGNGDRSSEPGFHQPVIRWKNYNCQQRIRLRCLIAANLLPVPGPWPGIGGHKNGLAISLIPGGL